MTPLQLIQRIIIAELAVKDLLTDEVITATFYRGVGVMVVDNADLITAALGEYLNNHPAEGVKEESS